MQYWNSGIKMKNYFFTTNIWFIIRPRYYFYIVFIIKYLYSILMNFISSTFSISVLYSYYKCQCCTIESSIHLIARKNLVFLHQKRQFDDDVLLTKVSSPFLLRNIFHFDTLKVLSSLFSSLLACLIFIFRR